VVLSVELREFEFSPLFEALASWRGREIEKLWSQSEDLEFIVAFQSIR
jgi:hypothetical protein